MGSPGSSCSPPGFTITCSDSSRCLPVLESRAPSGDQPEARVLEDLPGLFSLGSHRRLAPDSGPARCGALPYANRAARFRQETAAGEPARSGPRSSVFPPAPAVVSRHCGRKRALRARGRTAKPGAGSRPVFTLAPSLGGVESLVSIPVLTSHAMISADLRQKMGVTEQLIRLSVGIENADDLIADIEQALTSVSPAKQHAEVG